MKKHQYLLESGEVVSLSPSMFLAIKKLNAAIESIARGQTTSISLVEYDGKKPSSLLITIDGAGLIGFADALREHADGIQRYGSLWEGNAPASARSFREQ